MRDITIDTTQKNFVFVLQINEPIDTLRRLALFFQDNNVVINDFNLHRHQDGTAMVIANCMMQAFQIETVTGLLSDLPGIVSVQQMVGK